MERDDKNAVFFYYNYYWMQSVNFQLLVLVVNQRIRGKSFTCFPCALQLRTAAVCSRCWTAAQKTRLSGRDWMQQRQRISTTQWPAPQITAWCFPASWAPSSGSAGQNSQRWSLLTLLSLLTGCEHRLRGALCWWLAVCTWWEECWNIWSLPSAQQIKK